MPPSNDPEALAAYREANDPLEPMNKYFFDLNNFADEILMKPLAGLGNYIALPDFAQDGVRNAVNNVRTPVILANDLFQGEFERAGTTLRRFWSIRPWGSAACSTSPRRWASSATSRTCAGPGTPRPRTSSRASTPRSGTTSAATPSSCSAPGPGAARRPGRRPRGRPPGGEAAADDLQDYLDGDRWYQGVGRGTGGRRRPAGDRLLLARVRHHRRPAAVLRRPRHPRRRPPQGRHRPRRADRRRRACSTGPATSRSRCRATAGSRSATRCSTPTACRSALLREAGRQRASRCSVGLPGGRAPARPGLEGAGRPGAAAAARLRRRGQRAGRARRHRPALRRRQRAPAAPGDAARHRRRPRPARATAALTGAPGARGLPHQRGPRRLPRPRAHPRADRGRTG